MKPKTPSDLGGGRSVGLKKPTASAKAKAVALLARREHSQAELRSKLLSRGYGAGEVEDAIQWATNHQFQSDDRFKLSLFRRRAPTFGDRAISAELGQHGLGNTQSIQLEELLADSLASEEDRAYDWIMRRKASELAVVFTTELNTEFNTELSTEATVDSARLFALKSKVFKGLSSRGFEFSNIDRAWRRILAEFKSNA